MTESTTLIVTRAATATKRPQSPLEGPSAHWALVRFAYGAAYSMLERISMQSLGVETHDQLSRGFSDQIERVLQTVLVHPQVNSLEVSGGHLAAS